MVIVAGFPGANTAPVAANDAYSVEEDVTLSVPAAGVLANDTDADGDPLTAILVSSPSSGALTLDADGSFIYTPNANFNGLDSFSYRANDGHVDSNTATVSITVTSVNDAPVANPQDVPAAPDLDGDGVNSAPVTIMLSGFDVEGSALTFTIVTLPTLGSLETISDGVTTAITTVPASLTSPTVTYFPTSAGTDSFTFTVFDGALTSSLAATVSISAYSGGIDNCPATSNPDQTDTDGDLVGNACDDDDDGDFVLDAEDNCPLANNPLQENLDGDALGNACDPDADSDGVLAIAFGGTDCDDLNAAVQTGCTLGAPAPGGGGGGPSGDIDGDGLSNTTEASLGTDPNNPDTDGDGVNDGLDNCKLTSNADQVDTDGDGIGDVCDTDADNDTVLDKDGVDSNSDGIADQFPDRAANATPPPDNCRLVANPDQANLDGDAFGNACDPDADNDTFTKVGASVGSANDCNDLDAAVNPGRTEVFNNGKDDDCNPATADTQFGINFSFVFADGKPFNEWLPTDGATVVITATVVDSTNVAVSPEPTITFSIESGDVTNKPGKFTNDPSTDTSADVTHVVNSSSQITATFHDYGGFVKFKGAATVMLSDGTPVAVQKKTDRIPRDDDNDDLADKWEIDHAGNLSLTCTGDNDTHTGSSQVGDKLTNCEESRGFMWGPPLVLVASSLVDPSFTYQTDALVPMGTADHFRTNPFRKDVFVKYAGYDPTTSPFAIGRALELIGIDVHAAASAASLGEANIKPISIVNSTVQIGDNRFINWKGPRDWDWDTKGECPRGTGTAHGGPCLTYEESLQHYAGASKDKPYRDGGGAGAVPFNNKLDPLPVVTGGAPTAGNELVEDKNDNGTLQTNLQGKSEDQQIANGELDGDKRVPGWETIPLPPPNLSPHDCNNNGRVELPLCDSTVEYTEHQIRKHTILHEIIHGLGCCNTTHEHDEEPTSLMYKFSPNWKRDSGNTALSDFAKSQIYVNNK